MTPERSAHVHDIGLSGSARVGDQRTGGPGLSVPLQLGLDIAIALTARIVLALTTSYRGLDADAFAAWARALHDHPLGEFYATAPRPDHLPGDLWLLKLIQVTFTASGGHDFNGAAFEFATNAVPMIADVLVGLVLFLVVRRWRSPQVGVRAARWYLLNPAVIVLAGAWGQWDSVSMLFLLAGLLALTVHRAWLAAAPSLAWAVVIKPLLALPAFVVLLWVWVRPHTQPLQRWRAVGDLVVLSALGVVTAVVLLEPFRVGLAWTPDGGSSLLGRVRYAADLHGFTTAGAANLWLVVDRSLLGPSDDVDRWAGLSAAQIGMILFVVLAGVVAAVCWRSFPGSRRLESLLWASAATTFACCLVMTRMHERYYFPVLVLLLAWSALRTYDTISAWFFWTFSALFVIDLILPMGWTGHDDRVLHHPVVLVGVGLLHIAFFAVLITLPLVRRFDPEFTVDASSGSTAARRTAPG
jgi:hypothetical protein